MYNKKNLHCTYRKLAFFLDSDLDDISLEAADAVMNYPASTENFVQCVRKISKYMCVETNAHLQSPNIETDTNAQSPSITTDAHSHPQGLEPDTPSKSPSISTDTPSKLPDIESDAHSKSPSIKVGAHSQTISTEADTKSSSKK